MTTADWLPPTKWWEEVTEEESRDLMRTLYDAEQELFKARDAAKNASQVRAEWESRVEELRKHIHRLIGAKP